jgi:hypothetical protein
MAKTFLHPEHRARMRELIQGFIEHCEFSDSLVGQIERFVSYRGRKYGFPTFTLAGDCTPGSGVSVINLIGINEDGDKTAAESLLELIERFAIQPRWAAGHLLRILPVSDPLALEFGHAPIAPEVWQGLQSQVEAFRHEPADGLIEVGLTRDDVFQIQAHGPLAVLDAAADAEEVLRRLQAEDSAGAVSVKRRECVDRGPWVIRLLVPRTWSSSLAVHWTSQFLIVFLRAHAEALLTQSPDRL